MFSTVEIDFENIYLKSNVKTNTSTKEEKKYYAMKVTERNSVSELNGSKKKRVNEKGGEIYTGAQGFVMDYRSLIDILKRNMYYLLTCSIKKCQIQKIKILIMEDMISNIYPVPGSYLGPHHFNL